MDGTHDEHPSSLVERPGFLNFEQYGLGEGSLDFSNQVAQKNKLVTDKGSLLTLSER